MTTTYDHFGFERHQAVAYNAHIYLTALTAGLKLAEVAVKDSNATFVADLKKSIASAQVAVVDQEKGGEGGEDRQRGRSGRSMQAYLEGLQNV